MPPWKQGLSDRLAESHRGGTGELAGGLRGEERILIYVQGALRDNLRYISRVTCCVHGMITSLPKKSFLRKFS